MPPILEAKGRSLIILPTRYGGFGLLLHYVIASVAESAANRAADKVVDKMFQRLLEIQETDGDIYDTACKMAKNVGKSARETWKMIRGISWLNTGMFWMQ